MKHFFRVAFLMLVGLVFGCRHTQPPVHLTQAEFLQAARAKEIYNGRLSTDPMSPDIHKVTGLLRKPDGSDEKFFITHVVLTKAQLDELLASGRFEDR